MKIFDWYIFKNLMVATAFIAVTLIVVVFLTQSLRFLELVIESSASSSSFWILTMLALPRFFEVILPLAILAAVLFVYNRMTLDSEMVVARAVGYSPLALARPALILAGVLTLFLWAMTMWVAPKALSSMEQMRQLIRAQISTMIFREGVFNQVGNGLTVYVRERGGHGELRGLMIHDARDADEPAATVLAQRGVLVAGESGGHQVVVYDGSRQEFDGDGQALRRLHFERYTIDLPESNPVRQRWSEPGERTIFELLNPDMTVQRDVHSMHQFSLEIHRRILGPLMAMVYVLVSCCALLLGPVDRRGQGRRIMAAVVGAVLLQCFFLIFFNLARKSDIGLVMAYVTVFVPLVGGAFFLSGFGSSNSARRAALYKREAAA